jgi:hypothetical protein
MLGEAILNQAEHHEDRGGGEPGAGSDELLCLAGHERPQRGADVDPHVEHGESGVEPGAALGIELGHHRAHVRLQQPHAEHDDEQAEVERAGTRGYRQNRIPERDSEAPDEYGTPGPDQPVGDPSARERGQIDACGVQAVDGRGSAVIDAEAALCDGGDQKEHQHGPHAVIGEPLPHLGEEQGGEAARMPQKGCAHDGALTTARSRWRAHPGAQPFKPPPRARRPVWRAQRSCPSTRGPPSRSLFRTGRTSAPPSRSARPRRAA